MYYISGDATRVEIKMAVLYHSYNKLHQEDCVCAAICKTRNGRKVTCSEASWEVKQDDGVLFTAHEHHEPSQCRTTTEKSLQHCGRGKPHPDDMIYVILKSKPNALMGSMAYLIPPYRGCPEIRTSQKPVALWPSLRHSCKHSHAFKNKRTTVKFMYMR